MGEYLKLRMYHLVLYNLSPIQQGIQSYHAGIRYARKFPDSPEFQQWADHDETVIILSAGGSNELHDGILELVNNNIEHAVFVEEDLYKQVSAVAFLADERVWDKKKYYDLELHEPYLIAQRNGRSDVMKTIETTYIEAIGGPKNFFLRNFIRKYRLA